MSVSGKENSSTKTTPGEGFRRLGAAIKKATDAGMSVSVEKDGIVVSVPEEKEKPDPKASLSVISPEEAKKIEKEMKDLLKPEGDKNGKEGKGNS